ncbi:AsnC family transcriptional regulator [Pseudomonas syringae pv. aceris str. M302273]|nr:AsnC family transcriptional regulator [Pseudomonas syringae pv. aceris str. M302273]
MDRLDRNILAELQKDGRLSLTDLGERVGLSLSPCHRRVRALEESGVIRGYKAQLDTALLGLNFSALVFATLREGNQQAVAAFEASLIDIPEVVNAQRLFGEPDYLLHVVAWDLPAFQKLYDERLSRLPNGKRMANTPTELQYLGRWCPRIFKRTPSPLSPGFPCANEALTPNYSKLRSSRNACNLERPFPA